MTFSQFLIVSWSKQLCSTICKSKIALNLVFVGGSIIIIISDESWHIFLKRFAASVQHITGQEVEVKEARENASINIMEQELELLRAKVDELTDEVTCLCLHMNIVLIVLRISQRKELRNELSQQLAEVNTLKTLPLGIPVHNPSNVRKPGPEVS